jgi:hypothetical protein
MSVPLNQEIVNDTAKLIMHRLIARDLARDPSLVERARISHARASERFPDRSFTREWDDLLRLPASEVRSRLRSCDRNMNRLRLSSPFVTADGVDFTDPILRHRIWRAANRLVARAAHLAASRYRRGLPPAG